MKNQAHKLTEIVKNDTKKNTNIRFIAITSGKGGVGKTTISANLGFALAKLGFKVGLFDADIGLANLDVILGVKTDKTILNVLTGEAKLSEIAVEAEPNLWLIPGESGDKILKYDDQILFDNFMEESKDFDDFDYFIIDTGAGIGENVLMFLEASDEVIVVTVPDPAAITDAYAMIKILSEKKNTIHLLLNQVSGETEASNIHKKIVAVANKNIKSTFKINLIGFVNKDNDVAKSVRQRALFTKEKPFLKSSEQVVEIAKKISNKLEHNMLSKKREQSFGKFFKRLLNKF